jgi:ABC-type Zn2+ transport system substrate-binding protein/surface adhesin
VFIIASILVFFKAIENNVFKFKVFELSSMCEKIKVIDEEEENNMMEDKEEVDDDDSNKEDDADDHDHDHDHDHDDGDVNMMAEEEEDNDEGVYKVFGRSEHQHCRTCKDCKF